MSSSRSPSDGERALAEILVQAKLAPAGELPELAGRASALFGASDAQILLVDHGQRVLVPMLPSGAVGEPLAVDSTLPGLAFRRVEVQEVDTEHGRRLWIPLLEGIDRLGVFGLTVAAGDPLADARAHWLAALLAELVVTKGLNSDAIARVARRRPMSLAAEMQWALMPPLTAGTDRVVVSAMLEPAYEVGGDAVDYALETDMAHVAVLDPMGHDLAASVCASLAIAAYRNVRRAGGTLPEMADAIERAIAGQFAQQHFTTAILATLDLRTGRLRWIDAGHPPALLLRGGQLVKTLEARPDPPLGIGLTAQVTVHEETLEPGDRLLFYTDGVVEARDQDGRFFGVQRLVDFVVRAEANGDAPPETMRRLSHAVLDHQGGHLQDDATHLMLEWLPDRDLMPLAGRRPARADGRPRAREPSP